MIFSRKPLSDRIIVLVLVSTVVCAIPQRSRADESPNVVKASGAPNGRIVFEPYVGASRGRYKAELPTSAPEISDQWLGMDVGVRMLGDATSNRRLLMGFDLRQRYGWADQLDAPVFAPDIRNTALSVRVELRPPWPVEPVFGLNWWFGDVWRLRNPEKHFTGNAVTLNAEIPLGFGRVYIAGEFGKYKEGTGFIYTGTLGDARLETLAVLAGVVYTLDVPAPAWLNLAPPQ